MRQQPLYCAVSAHVAVMLVSCRWLESESTVHRALQPPELRFVADVKTAAGMRGLILGLLLGQAFFLVGHNAAETIIKIDLDAARDDSVPVPQGYVGLSIEPMSQAGIYCKDAVFCQLLKNLVAYDTGTFNIRYQLCWVHGATCTHASPLMESACGL